MNDVANPLAAKPDCVDAVPDEQSKHERLTGDAGKTSAPGWRAELALRYQRRGARTVLAERRHRGPLLVQKAFYPEAELICHGVVLHPPGGIVGGDDLALDVTVDGEAHAVLTTPGATKWYRSAGAEARQCMRFDVGPGASLEWLPQPTIAFDGTFACNRSAIDVRCDGCYIGWEILCLGRIASGERLRTGRFVTTTQVNAGGTPLLIERGAIEGGSRLLASPIGFDGHPISGTLIAVSPSVDAGIVTVCRSVAPISGRHGVTRLPGLLITRYLGDRADHAFDYFVRVWQLLRPALLDRAATLPRIWRT